MGRFRCRRPGVLGLYVRMAKVAFLSSTAGGAKATVSGGTEVVLLDSTTVAYVRG